MSGSAITPSMLSGVPVGTAGSYQNSGNTIAKAFDENLTTYFDASSGNGDYAGLDLGSAKVVTGISFAPRSGYAGRMVGGIFQGSDSAAFDGSVTNLYTVTSAPRSGVLTTVSVASLVPFRYLRYLAPDGSHGNIAELRFTGYAPAMGVTLEADGTLAVYGSAGADTIEVSDGPDVTTVTLDGATTSFSTENVTGILVDGLAGDDTLSVSFAQAPTFAPCSVLGGDGDDNLSFSGKATGTGILSTAYIDAGAGDDSVSITGDGRVTLHGGDGNDAVDVDGTDDMEIFAYGDDGNDTFNATGNGEGVGGEFFGGNGNDLFDISDQFGNSLISGGAGTDEIDVNQASGPVVLNFDDKPDSTLNGNGTMMQIDADMENVTANGIMSLSITGDALANVITVNGDGGVGPIGHATLNGGDGNDTISVELMVAATINGGAGDDTINAFNGDPDVIDGGAGNDLAYYDKNLDTITDVEDARAEISDGTTISGDVFIDTNGDGKHEASEAGLANVEVYLDANNNGQLDPGELRETTLNDGSYSFRDVPTGAVILREQLPAPYNQLTPTLGHGIHLTVVAGATDANENFTIVDPGVGGTVSGSVTGLASAARASIYLDANNNGQYDPGEVVNSLNADGTFQFNGVPAGTYVVRQILTDGYQQVAPANDFGLHITLHDGDDITGLKFVDELPAEGDRFAAKDETDGYWAS